MAEFFNQLMEKVKDTLITVLPVSPFSTFFANFETINHEWLGWLNWIVPVNEILDVVAVWLIAIALFYIYSIAMRWIKMIGD